MEECINDYYPLAYGEYLSESRVDDVVRYWETQYYPANGARFYDWAIPFLLWQRLGPEFLELINQPVLILNGDSTLVSSPEEAELLRSGLVNAAGGAKLVIVEEAPDQFHFIPQFAAILIKEMMSFYCTLPKFQVRSFTNKERDHLKRALFEIADLRNDPAMKRRDPHQAASFSCVSAEVIETRKRAYQGIAQKDGKAFSPFGPKGELPRKFSERHLGDIAEAAQRSRARSDSGLWAGGVEQEEVESDEESDSRTATEGLGKKLAKFLRIGRSPRPQA
ncbi:hypothetical protein DACRYDRAFT_23374 [Dacryopinax primogenitus]|uniref:Alpha/beta-hydrolase n=1 Tax=Dacryopinax primogenitus (strain DJM 731) TaxID=1858805 RepID=M5G1P1_DACPD|nr:uncharacterized protein DACRYDRAFT_23374 [Dacryopinax primogenitus]EJT99786.1 hypothetical protein DACRYDRAFT_23374 [Dacryopinax primogenitus]